MITSFSGTKILKYPNPRVTVPSITFNINVGDSSETRNDDYVSPPLKVKPSDGDTTMGDIVNDITNNSDIPLVMRNNSMYIYGHNGSEFKYCGLTTTGTKNSESYINKQFGSDSSTSMVQGKFNYILPRSNVSDASTIYKSNKYKNNGEWKSQFKKSISEYSKLYDIDPNVILAQIFGESGFKVWAYSPTGAIGITQFIPSTLHDIAITNSGTGVKFTQSEIDRLLVGIPNTDKNTFSSRSYRMQVFQNAMDNPDLMIKAQCRYMKQLSAKSNNLLSTTLFAYNRGDLFAKKNYLEAYYAAKKYNGGTGYEKEGISYVYTIWKRLSAELGAGYDWALNYSIPANKFDYTKALSDSSMVSG
jgi:soluble lytic murein transglycosylase-like protein